MLALRALVHGCLVAACLAAPVAQPHAAPGDGSLEAYLAKVRAERDAEFQRLGSRVQELAGRLGSSRSPTDLKKIHAEIDALGSEAAPLLLPYLDPGAEPTGEREQCARETAVALGRSAHPALLEELVRLAHAASPKGRCLAVRVLGTSPDKPRAVASLRELYPETSGDLRAECVRSLAHLDPAEPLVETALADSDPNVVRAALQALTAIPGTAPHPAVLQLLDDASRASPVLAELVAYLGAPGREVNEDAVIALLRLVALPEPPLEARLATLKALPRLGVTVTPRLRKELDPLRESSDSALHEGTLVALTLLGETKAKRELLKFYDDTVEKNPRWPQAFQKRGDVELQIHEYTDAAKDYRTAIELHEDSARLPGNRDLWVNLARAYVLDDKPRQAAEALEDFGLTSDLRRELRDDPDFAALVAHPKYKRLFEGQ